MISREFGGFGGLRKTYMTGIGDASATSTKYLTSVSFVNAPAKYLQSDISSARSHTQVDCAVWWTHPGEMTIAQSAPASAACLLSSIVSRVDPTPVPAMMGTSERPASSSALREEEMRVMRSEGDRW